MDAADTLRVAAAPPPSIPTHKVDDDGRADAEMLQPATPTLEMAPPPSTSAPVDATDELGSVADALDELRVTADAPSLEGTCNGHLQPQSPERGDDDALVESLVSLPSPVAQSAPHFDVFATSPQKAQLPTDAAGPERMIPSDSVSKEEADPLAHSMSGLDLDTNSTAEASVGEKDVFTDETDDAIPTITSSEEADDGIGSLLIGSTDLGVHDEPDATENHDDAPQPPELSDQLQPSLLDPSLIEDAVPISDTVGDDESDEATESTLDRPDPAALSIPFTFDDTAPNSESPVESDHEEDGYGTMQIDDASAPPSPIPAPTPHPAASPATAPHSPPPGPVTKGASDEKAAAPSASHPTVKPSPPRPNKGASAIPGSKSAATGATAEAKLKNGRVASHPPPPAAARTKPTDSVKTRTSEPAKVKSSDSMKVRAPPASKTSLIKTKAKGGDGAVSSGVATVVKSAPLKPKPHQIGAAASSSSSVQDRVARTKPASKSPTPPVPPKTTTTTSAATSSKQAQDSTPPPPAPTSTGESDGIKSVKKRLSSSELEAASNRLYSDAIEAKKRKEVLKAELEEKCTFAPRVNTKRRPSIPDENNRFVAMHEKAKQAMMRKEELRQKREKTECTFKPKITAKARKLSMSTKSAKPRFENLYQQAQEMQLKRDVKKSESEQKAVEECSFKPKIKTMKSPAKSRPLYDAERLKQRKLALEQKKIETELSQCTFKPKVVAKAAKSKGDEAGGKTGGDAKLFDRLYQASQKKAENLEKLRLEREEQERLVATFHPKITAAAAAKSESRQPFYERLYSKDHMQKVTAEREQKKLEEEQKFTFKPQLTPVPDELKSKHSSPSNSPDKSIFERLYEEKDKLKDKIEAGDMIRKQKEMDGCTFHPNIETSPNRASDQPSVSIWERLLSYDKGQVLEEREKQRHELEMQECTFKPEVTPSEFFTPKKSPSVGIFDRLTGGAVSMPSSDMKRRESERKAALSVTHSKRKSVSELEGFQYREQATSIGTVLRSSNAALTPTETYSTPGAANAANSSATSSDFSGPDTFNATENNLSEQRASDFES